MEVCALAFTLSQKLLAGASAWVNACLALSANFPVVPATGSGL